MARTSEQKQESKARKNQLIVSALMLIEGFIKSKNGIADGYHALEINFDRLGSKAPQLKSLYLDVKLETLSLLKQISSLKRNQQAGALSDAIAKYSHA